MHSFLLSNLLQDYIVQVKPCNCLETFSQLNSILFASARPHMRPVERNSCTNKHSQIFVNRLLFLYALINGRTIVAFSVRKYCSTQLCFVCVCILISEQRVDKWHNSVYTHRMNNRISRPKSQSRKISLTAQSSLHCPNDLLNKPARLGTGKETAPFCDESGRFLSES